MNQKKYVCIGGHVRALDGDIHFIPPFQVARLYQLNPSEVKLLRDEGDPCIPMYEKQGYIILRPQNQYEDYKLPL